jgi:ADP-ribose pyrophosphatase
MSAELLARTTVHKGRILELDIDVVKLPTGHTVDMEVVRHPGSVVLIPIPEPGTIILIRQYRYTIDRWIWELPAGSVKPKEDPDTAAVRECEEEIGLVPHQVTRLRGYYPTPGFCDEIMTYYRCEDLRPPAADSTAKKDEDEEIEPRTFTMDEARELIRTGEIVDLKTLAGLSLI